MDEGLAIAPATAADLDAIVRIEKEAFPMPWCREFFGEELKLPGRLNLVARREGVVVGYIFTMWLFEEMHVNKIAVARSARRTGVADGLMANVLAFARGHEIESISLEVRASIADAQHFYHSLGFANTYVRKRYYPDGEAAVVMTLAVR